MKQVVISVLVFLMACAVSVWGAFAIAERDISHVKKASFEETKFEYVGLFDETTNLSIISASKKYGIPVCVICAIISTESAYAPTIFLNKNNFNLVNKKATSRCDCKGLMQVSELALIDYNNRHGSEMIDLYDVETNIEVGVWHYARYFDGDETWEELYAIYNAGIGNYNKGVAVDAALKRFNICLELSKKYFFS